MITLRFHASAEDSGQSKMVSNEPETCGCVLHATANLASSTKKNEQGNVGALAFYLYNGKNFLLRLQTTLLILNIFHVLRSLVPLASPLFLPQNAFFFPRSTFTAAQQNPRVTRLLPARLPYHILSACPSVGSQREGGREHVLNTLPKTRKGGGQVSRRIPHPNLLWCTQK